MTEHDLQNQIRLVIGEKQAAVIFRANVGTGYTGSVIGEFDGCVTLGNARRLSTGLPKGFPDLFGFKTVTVTPDMVGKQIAQFAFLEVKTPQGRASEAQKKMHDFLTKGGAIGGIVRSPEEALSILGGM